MILKIEQIQKELFSADFRILHLNEVVGSIHVQGKLGSMEADMEIHFFQNIYKMHYVGGLIKSAPLPNRKGKAFRPYKITGINGETAGSIFQVDQKEGWFTVIGYFEMNYKAHQYNLYPIGFGAEGGKHPVYCEGQQIAQVEKSGEIFNDLHHYDIYAIDQNSAEIAVLFSAYMYINANFKPGEKATRSHVKYTSVTTNKTLKEKYHPDFVGKIQP